MSRTFHPPVVDEGEPGGIVATVLDALAPSGERLRSTLLVLLSMLAVLAIWETFRLPEPAVATFLLLMIARGDALSTIGSSVRVSVTVSLGALIAVVVLSLSLSQPALRIPLMALMTFVTMLLVRGTTLGPVAFLVGFFAIFGTTEADNLQVLAMSTGDVSNSEGFGRPQIDYFPPEEALLHALLWLGVVAAVPALLLAVAERIGGADSRRLLLARFRGRTDAVAAFCLGERGAGARLRALAREGVTPLLDLMAAAEHAHGTGSLHDAHLRLARGLNRLVVLLIAWDMLQPGAPDTGNSSCLAPVAEFATTLASRMQPRPDAGPMPSPPPVAGTGAPDGTTASLAAEIDVVLDQLRSAEAERSRLLRPDAPSPPAPRRPFWLPNAFGAANVQFALKVTLVVMVAYLIESALAWQAISTCIVTCLFVALGTIGETVHKMTLRITGCLLGAALGIGSILLLMPSMTGFGQVAALFGAVAFASIWIAFGSPRIAYAGWQMLLAFSLTTLQGYGPTLDMEAARDRVLGILLGNLVITVVFVFVWPVRVGDAVRRDMAGAFDVLGRLMALEGDAAGPDARRASESRLRDQFAAAVARIGAVIPNDRFEPRTPGAGTGRIGRDALSRLAPLIAPISVIATDGVEPTQRDAIPQPLRDEVRAFHRAMQDWFEQAAAWVRSGERPDRLRATLPRPPAAGALPATMPAALARRIRGRMALYGLVVRQVTDFLDNALPPDASPAPVRGAGRSAPLAAG